MTTIELQSELMSYADRFASIMMNAFDNFNARGPSPEARFFVHGDIIYSSTSAYTIAALPNPDTALLDMVVVATLGRYIYEYKIRPRFGQPIVEIVKGFKKVEAEILRIARRVLSQEQQQELRAIITNWLKKNPNELQFYYIRFSELGADRSKSTLVKKGKTGGLFKSVKEVTQQLEETRMLVERGRFLATRLPLLTGSFAEFWTTQLLNNPEVEKVLADLHSFSEVSQRFAAVAEQMPQQIAQERQATIDQIVKEANTLSEEIIDKAMDKLSVAREATIEQFMNRIAFERQQTMQDLFAEEQRVKELVTELRRTLAEGNNLMLSTTALAEKLNLDASSEKPGDSKPFEIQGYRDTIAEVSVAAGKLTMLVDKIDDLVASDGLESLLSHIDKTIGKVEDESEEFIDHTFRQALFLILIWLVGYVAAKLVLQRFAKK